MPEITPRVGLKKPTGNEHVNRASYNENLQIIEETVAIDAELQDVVDELKTKVDKQAGKQLSSEDFTTAEKDKLAGVEAGATKLNLGTTATTAYRGDRGKIAYDHSREPHAPSNAQKNSDITKAEIEAKLVGTISTHGHVVTKQDVGLGNVDNVEQATKAEFDAHLVVRTATIGTSWSGSAAPFSQAISVNGVQSGHNPVIAPVYSTNNNTAIKQKEAWNMVGKIIVNNGSITVTCFEDKPSVSIPIQIRGV